MRSGVPLLILWIGLAACGRVGFTEAIRTDAELADTALVDTAPIAFCDWAAGPPFTQAAVLRPELSMPDTEYDPFLVPGDPLTINYVARIGSSGELFEAHRASPEVPFDAPVMRSDLNTPVTEESALSLERGGLHGYVSSNRDGGLEIYEVARATSADPLQFVRRLDELVTGGTRFDPWPFADGLGLVYSEAGNGPNKIWFASRSATSEPWGDLVEFAFNASFTGPSGATLTSDGRVLVFSAAGMNGEDDIFYATRSSRSAAFGTPQLLTSASSSSGDHEPSLRDDGCELFLARDTGPSTKWDIYSIPAVTPP